LQNLDFNGFRRAGKFAGRIGVRQFQAPPRKSGGNSNLRIEPAHWIITESRHLDNTAQGAHARAAVQFFNKWTM
jgi:hypothetical protein